MIKTILIISTALFSIVLLSSHIVSENGIAGRTGSPGETTCNSCHSGNPLNDAGGSITLNAPTLVGFEYNVGQTYEISVTVARTGVNLFGFAFEALTSTGANAGTLIVTDAATTAIKSVMVTGNSRSSVVHKLNGGATANSHTFTFNWTAPATNVGNVTFYFAGNAANGNGTPGGDFIYKSSQEVTPFATVGFTENIQNKINLSVFPNPATESTTISYTLPEKSIVTATLVSLTGQTVAQFFSESKNPGTYEQKLSLDPSISNGIYLVVLNVNGKQNFKKLIIR